MEEIGIIHFTNYAKGQSRASMSAVMQYTMQDKKTQYQGQQLVTGINCRPESAYADFLNTKLLYHKEGGTMFYHLVHSFPKGAAVDPVAAHAAAVKLADYFAGREVLVSTHTDRDHIHSHLIINSVSLDDGRKLHISRTELEELRSSTTGCAWPSLSPSSSRRRSSKRNPCPAPSTMRRPKARAGSSG